MARRPRRARRVRHALLPHRRPGSASCRARRRRASGSRPRRVARTLASARRVPALSSKLLLLPSAAARCACGGRAVAAVRRVPAGAVCARLDCNKQKSVLIFATGVSNGVNKRASVAWLRGGTGTFCAEAAAWVLDIGVDGARACRGSVLETFEALTAAFCWHRARKGLDDVQQLRLSARRSAGPIQPVG